MITIMCTSIMDVRQKHNFMVFVHTGAQCVKPAELIFLTLTLLLHLVVFQYKLFLRNHSTMRNYIPRKLLYHIFPGLVAIYRMNLRPSL